MITHDKLRSHIKRLVSEQITADRRMVNELDEMDKSIKTLNKEYRALINNSFSRIVLDDGHGGKLFDVQLYPVKDIAKEGMGKYDLRAYTHDSDRIYKNGVSCEDICEFIKNDLKEIIEDEDGSYVRKSLAKGKRPYNEDSDYEYKPVTLAEAKKKKDDDCKCETTVGDMEEVKKTKRQEEFNGKDLKDIPKDEIIPGIGMDELVDKIENAVWGAIKRASEEQHKKTAKANHDSKNLDTKKDGHTVTKQKRHSSKTSKMTDKPKKHETSHAPKGKDSKVSTPKVKDFNKDERKAKNAGKDEKYTPSKKK